MDYTQLEESLTRLRKFEETGKKLYLDNPEAFSCSVQGWEEFRQLYIRTGGKDPGPVEPFFMGSFLTEKDSFPEDDREVFVLLHDRYAPPSYHHLNFIKIVYALRGGFCFYVQEDGGERMERMEEGDFVIIPPEVNQAVFTREVGAVTVNIIIKRSTFGEAFYSLLLENDSISDFFWQMLYSKGNNRALLVRCGRDEALHRLVLEMCGEERKNLRSDEYGGGEERRPEGRNLIMKGYVMLLFGRAIRDHQRDMESIGGAGEEGAALPVIMRYIRENYTTVTMASLAAHFGRSEGYLSRYIRRETGRTFRYLLKEFRMKQAAQMIENSSCSMEQVSAAVGYADISCFYRNFRERFGMTPMQYRNVRSRIGL